MSEVIEYIEANYRKLEGQTRESVIDAFEAGAQSQQAKIDILQIKLNGADERAAAVLNHKNKMIDELQARVDGALSQINGITRFINEDNPSDVHALSVTVDCELSRIAHILKGNQDD